MQVLKVCEISNKYATECPFLYQQLDGEGGGCHVVKAPKLNVYSYIFILQLSVLYKNVTLSGFFCDHSV